MPSQATKPLTKPQVLALLSKSTLQKLATQFELPVRSNASLVVLQEAVKAKRSIKLVEHVLPVLQLTELTVICKHLELSVKGKKSELLSRLISSTIKTQSKTQIKAKPKSLKLNKHINTNLNDETNASNTKPKKVAVTGSSQSSLNQKGNTMSTNAEQNFLNELEKKLWTGANKLLPSLDASQYKHVLLGLVFLKYVSDAFDLRRVELEAQLTDESHEYFLDPKDFGGLESDEYKKEIASELEVRDYFLETNTFWVPTQSRWKFLQDNNKTVIGGAELKISDSKTLKISSIGHLIDNALDAIEIDNKKLKGVLNKRYTQLQIDQSKLGELIDLVATIPFKHASLNSKDILGHVYEYMLGQFALAEGKKGGQFYTPKSIVSLIVQILEPFKGRVYDPAMGSGGFFVQSEHFITEHQGKIGEISIYGQEYNHTTWQLAAMNMVIRGIDFNFGKEPASTYTNDQHPDLRADFVMANPPFNMKEWNTGVSDDDVRWQYGIPPAGNANFAWLQHMLYHTAPNGSLGLLLANGSMSSNTNNEGAIRQKLIEEDLVECMIALPGQLFTNTQIPACIWFLTKNKGARQSAAGRNLRARNGEFLFIDARNLGFMKDRVLRDFTQDDLNQVTQTFHNWQVGNWNLEDEVQGSASVAKGQGARSDQAGFCKSVNLAELQKHDFVLTPGRYVGAVAQEEDLEPFAEKMARLTGQLKTQFEESDRLESEIKKNLSGLGYDI